MVGNGMTTVRAGFTRFGNDGNEIAEICGFQDTGKITGGP